MTTLLPEHIVLLSVFHAIEDGVVVSDEAGFIQLVNPAAEALLGLTNGHCLGRPLPEVIHEPAWQALFRASTPEQAEITLPDGRIAQTRRILILDASNQPLAHCVIFHDTTLLKQLEQMKTTFVHTIAHDLKNPIAAIMLAGELLDKAGELNIAQVRIRDRIHRTAQEMHQFIANLSALDKLSQGFELQATSFDLVPLLQTILESTAVEAQRKELALHISLPEQLPITADKNRLQQMVTNLFSNALKYTLAGEIRVQLQAENGWAVLEVQDTGVGIPSHEIPYIFNRFYRVTTPETQAIRGLGMGLAIVKSIVEAHHGRIQTASQLGTGTTFTVYLPCQPL